MKEDLICRSINCPIKAFCTRFLLKDFIIFPEPKIVKENSYNIDENKCNYFIRWDLNGNS